MSEGTNKLKVGFISTWKVKCGIAEYTNYIVNEMERNPKVSVEVFPLTNDTYKKLLNPFQYITIPLRAGGKCKVVHIQYVSPFFMIYPIRFSLFPLVIGMIRLFSKAKIVVSVHELGSNLDTIFLKKVDAVIVHNRFAYDRLLKSGINKEKLIQIPLYTIVGNRLDKNDCKLKLGLAGKRVIAIFGFIHQNKGHDLLINAMPNLPKDTVLLVLGDANQKAGIVYKKELIKKVEELGLNERVIFKGYIENSDLPLVMNAVDIAVLPYRWIEASAALHMFLGFKIATVTSNLDYFKEVENKYRCIKLFKSGDSRELSDTLNQLLSNPESIRCLVEHCDKFVNSTCLDEVLTQTMNCYAEALAGHSISVYDDPSQKERIDWLRDNKAGNTLEAGCATGYVTDYVKADVGLDIREDRLAVAKNKYPNIKFIEGDATNLPFENDFFQTVMAPDMLEHVPYNAVRKIVDELLRVCSGQVLITIPNGDRKGYNKDKITGGKNPEHLWLPTKENISRVLSGFKCDIKVSNSGYFLFIKLYKAN